MMFFKKKEVPRTETQKLKKRDLEQQERMDDLIEKLILRLSDPNLSDLQKQLIRTELQELHGSLMEEQIRDNGMGSGETLPKAT